MTPEEITILQKLNASAAATAQAGEFKDVKQLKRDASSRSYFRASTTSAPQTQVIMVLGDTPPKPDEITNGEAPDELPFVALQRYLKLRHLPVPEILWADLPNGMLGLTDLGDQTLERELAASKSRIPLYKRALDLLVSMQVATAQPDYRCIAFTRAFDARLLEWEFDHFREFGLEARNNQTLAEPDRAQLKEIGGWIARQIDLWPKIFVHRDFQSRNLMMQNAQLQLIDFQDALLGSPVYDLVALLRDSYVQLDETELRTLLQYYFEQARERGIWKLNLVELQTYFDLQTIQRKLKDAGRFVFIDRVKHNPDFLPFVVPSLGYARQAVKRLAGPFKHIQQLDALLARLVPEWK